MPLEGGIGIRVCKRAAERGRQRFEFLRGLRGALRIFGAAAGQIEAGGRFRAVAGAVAEQRFCIGPSRDAAGGVAVRGRAAQIARNAAKISAGLDISPVIAAFDRAGTFILAGNTTNMANVLVSACDSRQVIAERDRPAVLAGNAASQRIIGAGGFSLCVTGALSFAQPVIVPSLRAAMPPA